MSSATNTDKSEGSKQSKSTGPSTALPDEVDLVKQMSLVRVLEADLESLKKRMLLAEKAIRIRRGYKREQRLLKLKARSLPQVPESIEDEPFDNEIHKRELGIAYLRRQISLVQFQIDNKRVEKAERRSERGQLGEPDYDSSDESAASGPEVEEEEEPLSDLEKLKRRNRAVEAAAEARALSKAAKLAKKVKSDELRRKWRRKRKGIPSPTMTPPRTRSRSPETETGLRLPYRSRSPSQSKPTGKRPPKSILRRNGHTGTQKPNQWFVRFSEDQ